MTSGRVPLGDAFASPDSRQRYVRRLFSTIADRYDLITVLLSYGRDRRWKLRACDLAETRDSARALDLACGTGDIAFELARRGARVTGLDVTFRMLQLARAKGTAVRFVCADMMSLPFADGEFDIVTTGYGLRNVPDLAVAAREIGRVLRPGGTFVSLDFNRPENGIVRGIYLGYLSVVGSALGWILHRDPDTYRYIPASIRRYPGAAGVVRILRTAGFAHARSTAVLGGLMAIHVAKK
jgi:demethylmenaquinone methyltransferase/2-methoxy-6-polyprenyl-1,4-benzoquinol methylase